MMVRWMCGMFLQDRKHGRIESSVESGKAKL